MLRRRLLQAIEKQFKRLPNLNICCSQPCSSQPIKSSEQVAVERHKTFSDPQERKSTELADKSEDVVSIESRSVATGLFLNRIDHKLIHYPEFTDTEEVLNLEDLCSRIDKFYSDKVDSGEIDRLRCISDDVMLGLRKLGLFGLQISKKHGGLSLNNKELCRVYESISQDWSILVTLMAHNDLTVKALERYGSAEQNDRYMPRLASGDMLGAFALHEEHCGLDIACMRSEGTWSDVSDNQLYIHGSKNWVTNGLGANLMVVFAKLRDNDAYDEERLVPSTAFIVDRSEHPVGISAKRKRTSMGLCGADFSDVHFDRLPLTENSLLGLQGEGYNVSQSSIQANQFVWGSVAAGACKRWIKELVSYVNATKRFDRKLSDTNSVRKRLSDMAMQAYVADSMSYYVAGLLDENSSMEVAVEGAMIKVFSRNVLRNAVTSAMQVMGARSFDESMSFSRHLRDLNTISAFMHSDDYLNGYIAMTAVSNWAKAASIDLEKLSNPYQYPWFAWKTASKRFDDANNRSSRFKHYINEHVHPSFEIACRYLEEAMSKFDKIFQRCLIKHGKEIDQQYFLLDRFSRIGILLFASYTSISRASRSYSIGLRNADMERYWVETFCALARYEILELLYELEDSSHYNMYDYARQKMSMCLTELKGWEIESPIQRNW